MAHTSPRSGHDQDAVSSCWLPGLQEKERLRAKKAKSELKHKLSFDDDFGEEEEEEEEAAAPARPPQQQAAQVGGTQPCKQGMQA